MSAPLKVILPEMISVFLILLNLVSPTAYSQKATEKPCFDNTAADGKCVIPTQPKTSPYPELKLDIQKPEKKLESHKKPKKR